MQNDTFWAARPADSVDPGSLVLVGERPALVLSTEPAGPSGRVLVLFDGRRVALSDGDEVLVPVA